MSENKTTPTTSESSTKSISKQTTGGLAVAALVVGIVAFVFGWTPIFGLLAGIAAVVLGIISLKKANNKGMSIAGIVLGGIGALTSIVFSAIWIIALASVGVGSAAVINASHEVSAALSAQDALAQKQIDAKKDFTKGDTATFGNFSVKANSVDTNYVPSDQYSQAADGTKYVLVNVTVKNVGDDSASFDDYMLSLSADGVSDTSNYLTVDSPFSGGDLAKGASVTGNIAYTVPATAKTLQLTYTTTVLAPHTYQAKQLVYTLALN